MSVWHLHWQAAVGRTLFPEPAMYARVRERLIAAHQRPERCLLTYALLPTEIHLVCALRAGTTPPDVARTIGHVVARWVRQSQPLRSPVFAGPFRAHRLRDDAELRDDLRMLGWRPVLQGLCRSPAHYAHAAHRTLLGLSRAQGFDARPALRLFGEQVPAARVALREWMVRRPTPAQERQWELERGLVLASGSAGPGSALVRQVRGAALARLVAAAEPPTIDGAVQLLQAWVLARLGLGGDVDLRHGTQPSCARARALVASLASQHGLCSASSVARYYGRAKATLSEQVKACRSRPADRAILAVPLMRVVDESLALMQERSRRGHRSP